MWINNRTEFSYRQTYAPTGQIVEKNWLQGNSAGIADHNNTFGHVAWEQTCLSYGIKPIFGVRLAVADIKEKVRRYPFNIFTFVARNNKGLKEIYEAVNTAHDQFYWRPNLSYTQLNNMSDNVIVLSGVAPKLNLIDRDFYLEISPNTPKKNLNIKLIPHIATIDNFYTNKSDKPVYESVADERQIERRTTAQHVLTEDEWLLLFPHHEQALNNLLSVSNECNVELPKAKMVKVQTNKRLMDLCIYGARKRKLELTKEYFKRLKKELKLIESKDYTDYFLVVYDMVRWSKLKAKIFLGASRGSAGGSLVCFLLGITEVDPLKYNLIFERFIDINRNDLPDIDLDFPDNKRESVLKYMADKYGKNHVAQIGNISRLQPKSALNKFAKSICVPSDTLELVKEEYSESLDYTFKNTNSGKDLLKKYPNMKYASDIINHADHASIHAAGLLVSDKKITDYCGINSRDKKRIAMVDKKAAEYLNLLKIDVLGLRTLSILSDILKSIDQKNSWLYNLPLTDKKVFKMLNKDRMEGVFQMEGRAIRKLAKKFKIKNFEDLAIISALGRPATLQSGSALSFSKRKTGKSKVKYLSKHQSIKQATKETLGVIVYQEQVMEICRNYGLMSWEDVSTVRKAFSKSKGKKALEPFEKKFIKGAIKNKRSKKEAESIWLILLEMGSYLFNKSHAIAYAMITYWSAYFKLYHPLDFACATLNHSKDKRSSIKLLRDLGKNAKIKIVAFDRDVSEKQWSIYDDLLVGGLMSLDGIAAAGANKIIACRKNQTTIPAGIKSKMYKNNTPFQYLYPARDIYGDYYTNPEDHGIEGHTDKIKNINGKGEYYFIGELIKKDLKNVNSPEMLAKRDGKYIEENPLYLNFYLEDDTESILCTITRKDFEEYGQSISDNGKIDKDWYLVHGEIKSDWNQVLVTEIVKITRTLEK